MSLLTFLACFLVAFAVMSAFRLLLAAPIGVLGVIFLLSGSLTVVVVFCDAQVSPNSKIPAIVDHDTADGEPQTVFESGAILLYLAQKTGQFFPTDARERVACLEWLFFQVRKLDMV